jgi:hypothetical protein
MYGRSEVRQNVIVEHARATQGTMQKTISTVAVGLLLVLVTVSVLITILKRRLS